MANKSTARTFYAAGTFFDILNQFGDISDDVAEKRRYCKYKAATILKAIKEGKTPTPGLPEEMDMKNADDGSDDAAPTATAMTSACTIGLLEVFHAKSSQISCHQIQQHKSKPAPLPNVKRD